MLRNRAKRKYGTVAQEIQFSGFYRTAMKNIQGGSNIQSQNHPKNSPTPKASEIIHPIVLTLQFGPIHHDAEIAQIKTHHTLRHIEHSAPSLAFLARRADVVHNNHAPLRQSRKQRRHAGRPVPGSIDHVENRMPRFALLNEMRVTTSRIQPQSLRTAMARAHKQAHSRTLEIHDAKEQPQVLAPQRPSPPRSRLRQTAVGIVFPPFINHPRHEPESKRGMDAIAATLAETERPMG